MKGLLAPITVHPHKVPQDVGDPTAEPRYQVKQFTGAHHAYVTDMHTNTALERYEVRRPGELERAERHAQRLNDARARARAPAEPVPEPVELTISVDGAKYVRRTFFYRAQSGAIVCTHSYFVGEKRSPITARVSWHEIQRVEAAIAKQMADEAIAKAQQSAKEQLEETQ